MNGLRPLFTDEKENTLSHVFHGPSIYPGRECGGGEYWHRAERLQLFPEYDPPPTTTTTCKTCKYRHHVQKNSLIRCGRSCEHFRYLTTNSKLPAHPLLSPQVYKYNHIVGLKLKFFDIYRGIVSHIQVPVPLVGILFSLYFLHNLKYLTNKTNDMQCLELQGD